MTKEEYQIQFEPQIAKRKSSQRHAVKRRSNQKVTTNLLKKIKIAIKVLPYALTLGVGLTAGMKINSIQNAQKTAIIAEQEQNSYELAYANALAEYDVEAREILKENTHSNGTTYHTLTNGASTVSQEETNFWYDHSGIAKAITSHEQASLSEGKPNDTKYLIASLYEEMGAIAPYENMSKVIESLQEDEYKNLDEYVHYLGYADVDSFIENMHLELMNNETRGLGR